MTLAEFKTHLIHVNELNFQLPDQSFVPAHFHITEVGVVTKDFIDCGGTIRSEKTINFQLWEANDFEHRLSPEKLKNIIEIAEKSLDLSGHLAIEVEYQAETIGKFGLDYQNNHFQLVAKNTACLAEDACGIPAEKQKVQLSSLSAQNSCCTPGSSCC